MMGINHKQQLKTCQKQYKKISDTFLERHIKPRIVIFVEDGTNLKSLQPARNKHGRLEYGTKTGPNNVAIDVNKYIAKYDFDIAMKLQPEEDRVGKPT